MKSSKERSLQVLRGYICKKEPRTVFFCCSTFQQVIPTITTKNPFLHPTPIPVQPSIKRGKDLLPADCGTSLITDRVVGGEEAELGAWPWMAAFFGRTSMYKIIFENLLLFF